MILPSANFRVGLKDASGEDIIVYVDEIKEAIEAALPGIIVEVISVDRCVNCGGVRGGVPGNENLIDGKILCDYCHAEKMH
jgi:hypothetical protein